jgi:hypothetical protein
MIVMRFMMKTTAMTTMMAGSRTVGLGRFSPVQLLDKRSEARVAILQFPDQLLFSFGRAISSKNEQFTPKTFDIWIPV